MLRIILHSMLRSVLCTRLHPMLRTMLSPMLRAMLRPVLRAMLCPMLCTMLRPMLRTVLRITLYVVSWPFALLFRLPFFFLGAEEFLLFASSYGIRRVSFTPFSYEVALRVKRTVIGLDYDFEEGKAYWSDVLNNAINRAPLNGNSNMETIIKNGLETPEGLAVDWINRKLYWIDAGTHKIEVSDMDGAKRLPLVTSGLDNPRAIAVHPFLG